MHRSPLFSHSAAIPVEILSGGPGLARDAGHSDDSCSVVGREHSKEFKFRLLNCSGFEGSNRDNLMFESKPGIDLEEICRKAPRYAVLSYSSIGFETELDPGCFDDQLLRYACKAAKDRGIHYLWVASPGKCFRAPWSLPTSPEEFSWHTDNLHWIYRHASLCIVIPGTPSRGTSAPTSCLHIESPSVPAHVHNAWTLLEVVCGAGPGRIDILRNIIVLHYWSNDVPLSRFRWVVPVMSEPDKDELIAPLLKALRRFERHHDRAQPGDITIVDSEKHVVASSMVYLLAGALYGLRASSTSDSAHVKQQPKQDPQSRTKYTTLPTLYYPQLFGKTSHCRLQQGTQAHAGLSKHRATEKQTDGGSDHTCDACILLLLRILARRISPHGQWGATTSQDILLSAATRYGHSGSSEHWDPHRILRAVLRCARPASGDLSLIRSRQDAGDPDTQCSLDIIRLLRPTEDSSPAPSSAPPFIDPRDSVLPEALMDGSGGELEDLGGPHWLGALSALTTAPVGLFPHPRSIPMWRQSYLDKGRTDHVRPLTVAYLRWLDVHAFRTDMRMAVLRPPWLGGTCPLFVSAKARNMSTDLFRERWPPSAPEPPENDGWALYVGHWECLRQNEEHTAPLLDPYPEPQRVVLCGRKETDNAFGYVPTSWAQIEHHLADDLFWRLSPEILCVRVSEPTEPSRKRSGPLGRFMECVDGA